jgi:hypothetical protein
MSSTPPTTLVGSSPNDGSVCRRRGVREPRTRAAVAFTAQTDGGPHLGRRHADRSWPRRSRRRPSACCTRPVTDRPLRRVPTGLRRLRGMPPAVNVADPATRPTPAHYRRVARSRPTAARPGGPSGGSPMRTAPPDTTIVTRSDGTRHRVGQLRDIVRGLRGADGLVQVIGRGDQHARRRQNHRNGWPSMQAWKDVLHPEHR